MESPPPAPRLARAEIWAGVAVALLTARALYLVGHFGQFLLIDDAFISFRYAGNLARGLGLTFNPGERVEGYTTFLWTLLLAACSRLGLDLPSASIVLGYLATAGTVLVLLALGRRLFAGLPGAELATALPPLLFAALGATGRYVVAGMETPLFAFLLTLAVYLLVREAPPVAVGAAFALAAMTRPEGVLYFALAFVWALAFGPSGADGSGRWRRAGWMAAGFLILAAPYLAWRVAYYGSWLPNTFHAKVGGGLGPALFARGWKHLITMVRLSSLELPLAFSLVALASVRIRRFWLLPAAFTAATCLYLVAVGGDFQFFFGPRFLMPVLPLAFLAAAEGVRRFARIRAVAAIAAAILLANALFFSWPARARDLQFVAAINQGWTELGRWLAAASPPQAVVALGAVGRIPYYSGRPTIDMLGLTDAHIGRRVVPLGAGMPGHEKFDTGYVLGRRPDYLVFPLLDPRGRPVLADWGEYGGRIEAEYEVVALAKASDAPGPWVLEVPAWTPELGQKGYLAAVYRRRPAISTEGAPGGTAQ